MGGGCAVVLAVNDLEAEAIRDLATNAKGCQVVAFAKAWGTRVDLADERLDPARLPPTVILVELAEPALEERLRAAGKIVHVVDHHLYVRDGRVLDRRHPRSSLEQVAALLGVTLTPEQRRIGINDRDYIPGLALAAAGGDTKRSVAWDEIWPVRHADLETRLPGKAEEQFAAALDWLRTAEASGDLAVLDTGRALAEDPCLILVRAPEAYSPVLCDALYAWCTERDPQRFPLSRPLEILAVYQAGGLSKELFFSGRGERFAMLDALLREEGGAARLTRWAGGGGLCCFFGAKDDLGGEHAAVDALADRLLDELLTGNRPLVSWRTHFLHALKTEEAAEPAAGQTAWKPNRAEDGSRRYFLEHLRDLLVPQSDEDCYTKTLADRDLHLRSYVWTDPGLSLKVTIHDEKKRKKLDATVPIRAVRVHRLLDRLAVVELECHGGMRGHERHDGVKFETEDDPVSWRKLLTLGQHYAEDRVIATTAQALDFTWAARFASSPYVNPTAAATVALVDRAGTVLGETPLGHRVSEEEVDGAVKALLAVMKANGFALKAPKPVFDERARVVSGIVGVGRPPQTDSGKAEAAAILARLATVDGYGTGHAYDDAFAVKELDRCAYDRFASWGTRYAVTDQSFVLSAYGTFAARFILPSHLNGVYRRMVLIVTMYAAVLNGFALEVAKLSREPAGLSDSAFRDLRRRFVRFANGLWFESVTTQLQGRELFRMIRDASPIAAEYEELKAEIERTDELLDSVKMQRWQAIGGGGLVLAVTSGLLGMNVFDFTGWPVLAGLLLFVFVLGANLALLRSAWCWIERGAPRPDWLQCLIGPCSPPSAGKRQRRG